MLAYKYYRQNVFPANDVPAEAGIYIFHFNILPFSQYLGVWNTPPTYRNL